MPVLSMDTRPEPETCSPRTAEEDPPSDSEWHPRVEKGGRRRQRNRDAARKSRQKTTQVADQLHQELQRLERENSSLQKEISALQRDRDHYSSVLERHAPHCCLNKSPTDTTDACSARPTVPTPVPIRVPTPVPTRVPTPVPTPVPTRVPTPVPTRVPTPVPSLTSHNIPVPATSNHGLHTPPLKSDVPEVVSVTTNCLDLHTPTQMSPSVPTPVPLPCPLSTSNQGQDLCPKTSCTVPSVFPHSTSGLGLHSPFQTFSHSVPSPVLVPPQTSHKDPIPSTSSLGLHTPFQTLSHSVPTLVPSDGLGPPHTSSNVPVPTAVPQLDPPSSAKGLHTPHQMSHSAPIPVPPQTSHKVPVSSTSRPGLHTALQTLSNRSPAHVQTNCPHAAPLTSNSGVKQAQTSASVFGSSTTFSTLLPPDPTELLTPGPGLDTILSDSGLDLTLFADPLADLNLVQLLEDNDWILNTL